MVDTKFSGQPRLRSTGADRRHGVYEERAEPSVPLAPDHLAIKNSTTRFPTTITDPAGAPRLLKPGSYQRKLGGSIKVGPWSGAKVFALTLIERATCPSHCSQWGTCYGNNMHWAHRINPKGSEASQRAFYKRLAEEVRDHCRANAKSGVAIRLHVLGDFFDVDYVNFWIGMMQRYSMLLLFGFTAHPAPHERVQCASLGSNTIRLGEMIHYDLNERFPDRCAIRFSGSDSTLGSRVVSANEFKRLAADDGTNGGYFRCAAQAGTADGCDTCGMCWKPSLRHKAVIFQDHGKPGGRRKK